jgi:subtilisin-like proprotein convertase family protein
MKKQYFPAFLFVLTIATPVFAQQILSVTSTVQAPYDNMSDLIRDHLTGSGVEILSVESNNDPRSVGFFTDGDSSIGLQRGLILTTGFAEEATEPGSVWASNANISGSIQPELTAIATESLDDVAYFRITFRPLSDSIRFRYVFASDEYPEFACSPFNDIFGFFLSGPNPSGGDYNDLNIALIPGTNLPVAINNLHPNNPNYAPCPPLNEQYYHDNEDSSVQPVYDGFTDIFIAEASVVPCATYEMVIAIADVQDSAYDSGVFLEAKSLESNVEVFTSLEVGEAIIPEVAIADTISFSFSDVPASVLPLQINIIGTALNGIDYQSIDSITFINSPGEIVHFVIQPIPDSLNEQIETVEFIISSTAGNGCIMKTFTLYIADPDSLYSPTDTVLLSFNGTAVLSVSPTVVSNNTWSFSNTTPQQIAPIVTLIQSEIEVEIPFDVLHDISTLQSVCINIQHGWDDDLDIYLMAPNGHFVELSTDNGGNGDNYTNTCFSPSASDDIRGGFPFAPATAAPFTGSFQPEGLWSDILGTPISGTWKLGVVDDFNNFIGTLLDWTITFSTHQLGNFDYQWSTGDSSATLLVNAPGNYSVTVSNQVGSFSKLFVVKEGSVSTQTPSGQEQAFRLLPNPSTGETSLLLDKNLKVNALKVYDMNGILLLEQNSVGPILGAGSLPNGVYIVTLECAEGIFVQKMLRW